MDIALAQGIALAFSGAAIGFIHTLSYVTLPVIQPAPEAVLARQWRDQYLCGFYAVRPLAAICTTSWTYLAFTAHTSTARFLYIGSALLVPSGIPFAIFVLRHINGALTIRAEKLAGPGPRIIPLTYSRNDPESIKLEKECSTSELVNRWRAYNVVRGAVMTLGLLLGIGGVVMG